MRTVTKRCQRPGQARYGVQPNLAQVNVLTFEHSTMIPETREERIAAVIVAAAATAVIFGVPNIMAALMAVGVW